MFYFHISFAIQTESSLAGLLSSNFSTCTWARIIAMPSKGLAFIIPLSGTTLCCAVLWLWLGDCDGCASARAAMILNYIHFICYVTVIHTFTYILNFLLNQNTYYICSWIIIIVIYYLSHRSPLHSAHPRLDSRFLLIVLFNASPNVIKPENYE